MERLNETVGVAIADDKTKVYLFCDILGVFNKMEVDYIDVQTRTFEKYNKNLYAVSDTYKHIIDSIIREIKTSKSVEDLHDKLNKIYR